MRRLVTSFAALLFVLFLGQGSAWACTVPNFFVNSTIADADQVNANFTAVLACLNVQLVVGPNSSTNNGPMCWSNATGTGAKDCSVPLSVANGGTGDTGTAWTDYTPVVTCQSGTLTSASPGGKFKTIGKTVFFTATLAITTNGTCAGNLTFTLPVTAGTGAYRLSGGINTTGVMGTCSIGAGASFMLCNKYDGSYLGGDGTASIYSGVYMSS